MNYVKFLRTAFLIEHLRWLLLNLTYNLISISICFCDQTLFQNPAICKMELFATVANVYTLSSLVGMCLILHFSRVPGAASWKIVLQYDLFRQKPF